MYKLSRNQLKNFDGPIGDPHDYGKSVKNDPISAIGAVGSLASGAAALMGGDSSTAGGNIAGGAYYDPYAAHRGTAADWLNALLYPGATVPGSSGGGSAGTPLSYEAWKAQQGGDGSGKWGGYSGWGMGPKGFNTMITNGGVGGWSMIPGNQGWTYTGGGAGVDTSQAAYDKYKAGFGGGTGGGSPMDLITRMPGYQFGMNQGAEALNRTLASTGQTQSGAQQIALSEFGQQYAGSFYDKMVNTLSQLSGATQSPLSMANQNQLGFNQQQAGWQSIGQGLGGLKGVFGDNNPMISYTSEGVSYDPNTYGQPY